MSSVCVFGAGAISGYLASKLGHAGTPVSVVVHADRIGTPSATVGLSCGAEEEIVVRRRVDDPSSASPA